MEQKKPAIMNAIWFFLVLLSVVAAAYTGQMKETLDASFQSAKNAVELALGLVGIMALWLGLMKVAEAAGLLSIIARWVRPVMVRLFPEIPPDHPSISAMVMNISANILGLGNAATPMGIKAMMELNKLNPHKGRATNAMCLFLAINTSSVTLLPLGVIGVRAAAGAAEPASIFIPTLVATTCSTLAAVIFAKAMAGYSGKEDVLSLDSAAGDRDQTDVSVNEAAGAEPDLVPVNWVNKAVAVFLVLALAGAFFYRLSNGMDLNSLAKEAVTYWLVPLIMSGLLLFGYLRGARVYEAATEGAKEGFQVAIRIIPFLVIILVGVGMFRASGAFDILVRIVEPVTSVVGMPADALPMALIRPLSGSGAFAVMSEVVSRDPNSFSSFLVSTMQGCTETTFYVLAVYFGAVGVVQTRYAVAAGLLADAAGVLASLAMCRLMF
ncbi:MAG: nucleoside recognition domain-containing protein [Pseudomonadota bacterium]